ncbi:MAG TPA: SdrD B-like domain-containing protein [Solirubrobacteraceae bacterium]|nr:SdrD B-like domain-containing protein [Solirubrobacteraceae bacterium]
MPWFPAGRTRALLCALAVALACAPAAAAAPLSGSSYDSGDGDQADLIGFDWQAAVAAGAVKESPDANDDCFVGGVKELTPDQWAFNRSAGGCTPGKSNLRVAYAHPESTASTTFGHFAFFRNDITGNTFLTFELNQAATSWTNATGTTIPCRNNGDLLISFEVGGSTLTTSLYRWTGDGSGPAACPNGANGTFTGSGTIPASRFQGAMNPSAIANFVNPAAHGATFPQNAFGEAAIDLPAVLQGMGANPCFGFLQLQVHSRSSSSISSAMIDYTAPVPVNLQSCAATGTQYQDSNGNGTRDGGEPPLAGFEMYADLDGDGTKDAGEPSGVSDATGFYRILGVPAGTIAIRQVPQAGWRCSQPNPCSYTRTFAANGNSTGNDFGNLGPSTASGTSFDDLDGDGVQDAGEPGLSGVDAYADLDGDGTLDAGEPSDASDGAGAWTIGGIPAGTYAIRQATPAGRTCSTANACAVSRTFSSGSAESGIVFGSYAPGTLAGTVTESGGAAVSGAQVFLDADGDDAFDLGEPQTTTSASGAWSIGGLAPGPYTARVTLPSASWYCVSSCERGATVTSGLSIGGQDFTLARYATVSGTVWDDVDGDGVRDAGDAGIAGFTTWVDYDGDNTIDAGEPSATSDGLGAYALTGVRAGSWTVRQAPNGAYQCTFPVPCTYAVTLASNGSATARDFGDFVSRSVSGTVYDDRDADGVVGEPGETALSGWVVYSDANNNGTRDAGEPASTTNSLGVYNVTGVANGSYRIRLVGQAGWTCSYPSGCVNTGSLGSGQSDTGKHFGVWGPATISGTVREDGDANGTGDAALAGRTVYVDSDGDGTFDAGEPSAASSATGAYAISGLNPGTYTVRQVLPAGWTCSQPTPCSYTIATATGTLSGRDFASHTTASISGTVREDVDADGSGDAGLAGRTVYLDADGDGVVDGGEPQTASAAGGGYAFTGLAPGTYRVRQVLPAGWTQSAPAAAHVVTVASGASAGANDFASWTTGSISGTAFEDADFDGSALEAGDGGLAGRTLYLDLDADGTQDGGEPQQTTGGAGGYTFSGLAPGEYTVRPVLPAGWACAYPSDCAETVTVTSGGSVANTDFGSYVGASVSGTVFEDLDADGAAREAGEPGASGRRVYLDGDADGARDATEPSVLTDAAGAYAFSGIVAQAWQVRLELSGGDACDSPSPCRADLVLTSGANATGHDFGVHRTGSIGGHLFTDRDADGQPQAFGENDQPERTVYLDADDDGTRDPLETAVQTDDLGAYAFGGLQPGVYRVRQELPAGWTCSTPAPCVRTVTLTSGEAETGHDFSSWTTASLTGVYFEDADADGEFPEAGEAGVAGRTVYVDEDGDGAQDAGEPDATTAGDGSFTLTGLDPGTHAVRSEDQPAGWTCSYPSPCSTSLTLEAGERAQDVDFGTYTTGTVSGTVTNVAGGAALAGWTVFADADGDGTLDAGETSDVTDAAGAYELALEPGDHVIREVVQSGWACTTPAPCRRDVTVTSQASVTGQDFENGEEVGSISGTVREDVDADGDGDAPLAGRTVYADLDGDGTHDAGEPGVPSAADGTYMLSGLAAGDHEVRLVPVAGSTCSAPGPCVRALTLTGGQAATGQDFAVWLDATVAGTVDDDGGPGVEGATVYVDADDDGARDAGETSDDTDASGDYSLGGLRPGTHRIRLDLTGDWRCTAGCAPSVSLDSGETATQDFSIWRPGSIAGTVREDADADGDGDAPLAGRTVYADLDGDGSRDAGEPDATSAADGTYTVSGLTPGAHEVRLVPVAGSTCSAPDPCLRALTLASGEAATGRDFAVWRDAAVSGTVTDDGGPGVEGVTVYVDADDDGTLDAGETQDDTDASGDYSLGGLRPGTHRIRMVLPGAWQCTAACSAAETLDSGGSATRDFSVWRPVTVSGTVREDTDADGDGDQPFWEARTVYADVDGDGTHDVGEPATTSAGDGSYTLAGLAPGAHEIRLVGVPMSTCSAPDPCVRSVTGASGQSVTGQDFAVWRDAAVMGIVGAIGGSGVAGVTVYVDEDDDGTLDAGETRDVTTSTGDYVVGGLRPGTHRLRMELPGDWRCSTACSPALMLQSGETAVQHFTIWRPSTASGTVFVDLDGDGAPREAGEPGRGGVRVYVDGDGDGARDPAEPTATTSADGTYTLSGLAPGTHAVRLETPDGWRCTRPDPCTSSITTTSGSTPAVPDFGVVPVNADLSVTIDRDPATVIAGRPVAWTIAVANGGPVTAENATLTVDLPEGVSDLVVTPPAGVTCDRTGLTLTCTLGDLPSGGDVAVEIAGDVDPDRAGEQLPVHAAADADQPDPDASDDEDDESPPVEGLVDLRTSVSLPPTATVGDRVDVVLEVTNSGPSDGRDLEIVVTLPEGLDPVVEELPAGCTAVGRVVTCTAAALPLGGSLDRTIPVVAGPAGGGATLTVPVAATSADPDPTPPDASDEAEIAVSPAADVRVTSEDTPQQVDGGYEYDFKVRNHGPSPATEVVVVDGPFPGARIVSVTTSKGTCTVEPDGSLRCELGELALDEEVELVIVLELDEGKDPEDVQPLPTASAAEADPAPENNTWPLVLPPAPPAPQPQEPAREPEPEPEPQPAPEPAPELRVLPAQRAGSPCASTRAFDIRVRRLRNHKLRRVTMTLDGRPLAVRRRKGRFVARVDLRGRPPGSYVLRILAVTTRGKVLRGTRTYRTCEVTLPYGTPPL